MLTACTLNEVLQMVSGLVCCIGICYTLLVIADLLPM